MKTILRSLAVVALLSAFNNLQAQCTVTPATVSNIQKTDCKYTFDLSFNLQGNGGNKVTAVYVFNSASYASLPAKFYGQNNNGVPSAADLNSVNAVAVIKVNTDSTVTMYNYQKTSNTYVSPTAMKGGLQYIVSSSGQITIQKIPVSFNSCSSLISLTADVVSSQSPDLTSIGCITKGLVFSPNAPIIRTQALGCGSSPSVRTTFITTDARTITFRIYKDVAPLGQFTKEDTAIAVSPWYSAEINNSSGTYSLTKDYSYTVLPGEKFNVWLVAYTSGITNVSTALTTNTCSPLPITFRSFSAQRNKQSVALNWETATEINNRGFNVQRQAGGGAWQTIGFVGSLAANGNSSSLLSYSYTDLSPVSGISQYRLQQIDVDGKTSFSEIRSVRSTEIGGGVTVYPNPSSNGIVTLAFENTAGPKDITVSDMAGRVIKRFTGVKNNNLTIDNLTSGFYTIQIFDPSTAATTVEKVVVKKP